MIPLFITMAIALCHSLQAENDEITQPDLPTTSPSKKNEGSSLPKNGLFTLFGYSPLISGEEKELSKLHGSAESAIQHKEYLAAEKAFEEIIKKVDPPFLNTNKFKVDWPTYIDLVIRLAETKLILREFNEGKQLLRNLEKTHPPQEYLPSIYFLLAKFHSSCNNPEEAYCTMLRALPLLPIEKWKGEDRSFFHGIEYLLNDHFDNALKRAKRFASAYQMSEAISMYEEILAAIEKGGYPRALEKGSLIAKKVKYRLAELYYAQAKYEKALSVVETNPKQAQGGIDSEMLYLAACAFRQKKEYEKAIEMFDHYINSGGGESDHLVHAYFEIGVSHFKSGAFEQAKMAFKKILKLSQKGSLHDLALFYLAQISLFQGELEEAGQQLTQLSKLTLQDEILKADILFFKGEIAFAKGDYPLAIELYEEAKTFQKEWKNTALYKLALSYAEVAPKSQKAEKILNDLLLYKPNENILLSLAELYLKDDRKDKIEALFDQYKTFFTREGEAKSLLLLAEASNSEMKKEELLLEATSARFEKTSIYPECIYQRGVWALQHSNYQEAIDYFEKGLQLEKQEDLHLQQCLATANFYKKLNHEALQKIEALLERSELKENEKDEALYLKGLIASTIVLEGALPQSKFYTECAITSFQGISSKSKWKGRSLFALASFFYKKGKYHEAEKLLSELLEKGEESPLTAHALFWAAEAEEKLGGDSQRIASLRKRCYEEFPHCQMAPLAFFKKYHFEKYLSGDLNSIFHLKAFPQLFPRSPLAALAYYLVGIHETDFKERMSLLEKAVSYDKQLLGQAKEHKNILLYYQHKATYAYSALLLEQHLPVQKVLPLLEESVKSLEKSQFEPSLKEEGELLLSRCYIACDEPKKGEALLLSLLDRYKTSGVHEGYFLSKVLAGQADLAMKNEEYKIAMTCFEMAENCGENYLPLSEKMSLWIEMSECCKKQKKYEQAMKILSRVINEDGASPLREKAMYLRAELYELEGRHELAIRQLEASAKRAGQWAEMAKKKLRNDYGL